MPGKNEAERAAHVRLTLDESHTALERAEQDTREARKDFDLAQLGFDVVKLQLRLLEATKGGEVTPTPA